MRPGVDARRPIRVALAEAPDFRQHISNKKRGKTVVKTTLPKAAKPGHEAVAVARET